MKTEISAEGLANALIIAHEEEQRKNFDNEVLVWFHILAAAIGKEEWLSSNPSHIYHLFAVMESPINRSLFQKGIKQYRSDEVPTDFMRKLYRQYLAWKELPKSKQKKYQAVELYKESEDAATETYKK